MKSIKSSKGPEILAVIGGPTASGKSETAAWLAKLAGGVVISADSVQIYSHMDIGSSKPGPRILEMAPHKLLSVISPDNKINAFSYSKLAREEIRSASSAGKLPVLVGGTGLYIKAVIDGIFEGPKLDPAIRAKLEVEIKEKGSAALHAELKQLDPEAAGKIHMNDVFRITRALEVFRGTGTTISALQKKAEPLTGYNVAFYAMYIPRGELYAGIDRRVDAMTSAGLLAETKMLMERFGADNVDALKSLGYKQMRDVVEGRIDIKSAVKEIKTLTRNYAKRQFTWFKHDGRYEWIENNNPYIAAGKILKEISAMRSV